MNTSISKSAPAPWMMATNNGRYVDPTASEKADSSYEQDDGHDEIDDEDDDANHPPPKRSLRKKRAPYYRGATRKIDREHSATIRVLAAEGWSCLHITQGCTVNGVATSTVQRAMENNYSSPDNVESDYEHAVHVQAYKDKWEERRRAGRSKRRGAGGPQGGLKQSKLHPSDDISERRVSRTRVRGPFAAEPPPAPEPKTVKKPEEPNTRELRAFLRTLGESNMQTYLVALRKGGIRDDETFHAISMWNNEELVEFFKQFEDSGWLDKFQWSSLKRGLTQLKNGYGMSRV
ncbi:hypothetical protein BJ138DRAFT_1182312 [Hygrophoropsis aurantiaca]|uniref:Uncharacterized protein n=1 Tax=Hygrophoropsis aurantiaca TaxID=72124 RepID=A0ACB8A2I7_9AGAM|nr:hypothetical protein BJ138DRAFT_1182312 [Hygrophoropsis aurantiaca]